MAIVKIHEIVLYTTNAMNERECFDAVAWMDHNNIQYRRLHYNADHPTNEVTDALNTWWPGKTVSYWPFVVYREQHDDRPLTDMPASFIEGLENIKTELPKLAALAG